VQRCFNLMDNLFGRYKFICSLECPVEPISNGNNLLIAKLEGKKTVNDVTILCVLTI
jgi:hypothetical protein